MKWIKSGLDRKSFEVGGHWPLWRG